MISIENLEKLSRQYQSSIFPNIIREYFQHIFLSALYKLPDAGNLLFKGGTALRVICGSPRFSEDLDFSLLNIPQRETKKYMEDIFLKVLAEVDRAGIKVEIGEKSNVTSGGYFGTASFKIFDYPSLGVEINVSTRSGDESAGEIDSVANDFTPTYNLIHLSQNELVDEKIFGALMERGKPRDYYDLYFIMRKGMLSSKQKRKLSEVKNEILNQAKKIDFRGELGAFLPANQQAIIRDFYHTLAAEIDRQLA